MSERLMPFVAYMIWFTREKIIIRAIKIIFDI